MQRRAGYTLIELLVSMALILTIMTILSQAYIAGMDTFSKLKGIGDMSEKLREVTTILRRDLAADHFTGGARVSDPTFFSSPPREGFVVFNSVSQQEPPGADAAGNPSYVSTVGYLHFTVKLRGNRQQDFFLGDGLPPSNPTYNGTFFNQSADATYGNHYQWAEVAYYVLPIQDQLGPAMTSPGTSLGNNPQQLYALYRAQRAIVANSGGLPPVSAGNFPHMSISPQGVFNTPTTVQAPGNRGIVGPAGMPLDALLVSDVLNFDVQVMPTMWNGLPNFTFVNLGTYDTGAGTTFGTLRAVRIILRVYDLKSRQARQITVVQDL